MIGLEDAFGSLLPDGSVSHYDLVLALVPAAFVVAVLVGHLLAVPPHAAMAAAATVAALAVVDVVFLRPPQGSAGGSG